MREMIKDLEDTKGLIDQKIPGMKAQFDKVGVSTKPLNTLTGISGWIGGELPMLNRRHSMAEQLSKENYQYGFNGGMVFTEWEGLFKSKAEAEAKAKELAAQYKEPGQFLDDAWEQIRKYQNDTDFAQAFVKQLGPEKMAWLAGMLRSEKAGQQTDDRLGALANILATASHRGAIDAGWLEKFSAMGQGTDLATLGVLLQHGTWNKDTLVLIGQRALSNGQLGGGNYLTAAIFEGIARNPLAAHELYGKEFDRISAMARGQMPGWIKTKDPKLLGAMDKFMTAATVEAVTAYEHMRPVADPTWRNPAAELSIRLLQDPKLAAYVLPGAPAPPAADEGHGVHGSQEPSAGDRTFEAFMRTVAMTAEAMGMNNAARHINHYLGNSGSPITVDVEDIFHDVPSFKEHVDADLAWRDEQLRKQALDKFNAGGGQPVTVPFGTGWNGYYLTKEESQDWYFAMGGISYSVTGTVTAVPDADGRPKLTMHYQVHVHDRYNWDAGKAAEVGPITIEDTQMGRLHTVGLAWEYDVDGTSDAYSRDLGHSEPGPGVEGGRDERTDSGRKRS
jgi:hypothetical protein